MLVILMIIMIMVVLCLRFFVVVIERQAGPTTEYKYLYHQPDMGSQDVSTFLKVLSQIKSVPKKT